VVAAGMQKKHPHGVVLKDFYTQCTSEWPRIICARQAPSALDDLACAAGDDGERQFDTSSILENLKGAVATRPIRSRARELFE
jgi:hypothetical protein